MIVTVKNVDYRCIIHKINKLEAINLLKNCVHENRGIYIKHYLRFQAIPGRFFCF